MKGLKWVGVVIVAVIALIGVFSAMQMGEKSPLYVAGEIQLDPELQGHARGMTTYFVIINDPTSPMPMPLGAMKEKVPADLSKPIPFLVTKESLIMMNPDAPLPTTIRVKVRFDMDGVAGMDTPGDLVGIVENVPLGEKNLNVRVSQKVN